MINLIPEKLIMIRTHCRLSIQELSELIGVNRSTIKRWENGEMIPKTHFQKLLQEIWLDIINNIDITDKVYEWEEMGYETI